MAFEMGQVPDRRVNDRRRAYRRAEEKNLIATAYQEAEAIRANARKEGFQEGIRQAKSEVAKVRVQLNQILSGREEALASVADDIAGLAIEVAQRILKTEVSCDEALVMRLVHDTIQRAGRNVKSLLIKVHPDDVTTVKHSLKMEPIPNLNAEIIVMEDATVDAGSCIVETNSGLIDASFATQLELLKSLFGLHASAAEPGLEGGP
jgi:flagellar assembly protein FliH